ncbi:hypothetical protein Pfo_016117 [Paulownia fortunei]|nr:hypothetical protein Pfo_016117 [Paulownia fortunei]
MGISENDDGSRSQLSGTRDIRLTRKGSGSAGSSSWILIDSFGEEIVLEVDKYAIMQRLHVHARDLRILDPLLSYSPTILTRNKAIILNFEVLFRYPSDDEVIDIVEEFRRKLVLLVREINGEGKRLLQHNVAKDEVEDLPFEFRVLEVALEVISSSLDARTEDLETAIYQALDMLTEKVRDELKQLLNDNNYINNLYLSKRLANGKSSLASNSPSVSKSCLASPISKASVAAICGDKNVVGELETLLEAYYIQIEGTLNRLITIREYVGCAQDFINIQVAKVLEHHRNQLLQLELFLSTTTLCLTLISLVAALFGVSIPYKWNYNHAYTFKWVLVISGTVAGLLFILIISHARRKGLIGS